MTDDRRRSGSTQPRPSGGQGDGPIPTFDLYAVLNVRPGATQEEIREAVALMDRRLQTAAARDRGGSTARQKRFNVARHWLLDPARRRRYDTARAQAAAAATAGRVGGGKVGGGSATRRSGAGRAWYLNPLAWAGGVVVLGVVAFLVLRPGGLGGSGSSSATASPSAPASGAATSGGSGAGSPGGSATAVFSPRASNPPGCPTAQPPAGAAGQTEIVTISTDKGDMQITVDNDLSPIAAGNFVALAGCGFYDGVPFHRAATLQDGTPFVIQGGDPTGTGSGGPGYTIQDEKVTTPYKRGTVAMARTAEPNSVGSQFFIVLDDKDADVLASANTYQIIGSVTSGMETADAIYQAAGGEELPTSPVVMNKVTVASS
ncbi:MAG TPA: peptidylprolyl isomerase [Candidatus Limnocylindrales bacterium]|jgi:peptidyl-prolyl cis-trans isomerase B (cyclophilin B)